MSGPDAPQAANRARFAGPAPTETFLLYWTDVARFERWQGSPALNRFWDAPERLAGEAGYWREIFKVPVERLETLFSSENPIGLAETATGFGCPVREHAYWGGARDRIPASSRDAFAGDGQGRLALRGEPTTRGRRLRIVAPKDMCVIRSGQYWGDCGSQELEYYMREVHPVLVEGMNYLADNPLETNCLSCRFMEQPEIDGSERPRTFGLAYFLTLEDMETWAEHHPTHLKIFNNFLEMVQAFQGQLDLKLWHEVSIIPADGAVFDYVNCHPRTGLLPFCPASDIAAAGPERKRAWWGLAKS